MKVQILVENTTNSNLIAEHGLSIFIEYNDKKILLDAGTTSAFIDNAEKMNVDISKVDFCVLSHGHYDHSGGFAEYLRQNPTKKVYAMKAITDEYYSASGGIYIPLVCQRKYILSIKRILFYLMKLQSSVMKYM